MNDRKITQILRVLSTFRTFKRLAGKLLSHPKLAGGDSSLVKENNDVDFCKFSSFLVIGF